MKCSGLKSSKERLKHKTWKGPCCTHINNSTPSAPPLSPSNHPTTSSTPFTHRIPHIPIPSAPPPSPPHAPPTQQQQQAEDNISDHLTILQYNINGIQSKIDELLNYMDTNNIKIAAIQETKLTNKSKQPKTKNYTFLRKDRGKDKGGGLAFLVHESIDFNQEPTPPSLDTDPHLESLTITIPGTESNLQIRNIYIPPNSSCQQQYTAPLDKIFDNLNETSLIIGDINAHHSLWYSKGNQDFRGRHLADLIIEKPFGILNEDNPTRIMNDTCTAPDISLASNSLLASSSWKTEIKMSSDHLPILINISADIKKKKSQDKVYMNFGKADWSSFTEEIEIRLSNAYHSSNVHDDERFLRRTIQRAANKYIPSGRIMRTVHEIPKEALRMINERDQMRSNNPSDPRLQDLNNNINKLIADHKLNKWRDHIDNCQPNSKNLWNTIKDIQGQPQQPNNQGIKFNDKIYNNPKKLANKFNSQYTPPSDKKPKKESRKVLRKLKKIKKIKQTDNRVNITETQTKEAIKKTKNSKALGPDEISPLMLKHLGPNGIRFLTHIYNECVNTATIPALWKTGRIIPLLKPGKPTDVGSSYRPISLLSPLAKVLESILLPEITESIHLARHQHGFRKGHSTTTALHNINNFITEGLNKDKPVQRTVAVAIDLSRAFDTVDHDILLDDIDELQLNGYIKRFLCAYIRGRQTYVEFRGSRSKCRKMLQGVPQGGVLSPILFNLYMAKIPQPPVGINFESYADNTTVLGKGPKHEPVCQEINLYLDVLDNWFKQRNLYISPTKSSATIFTTFSGDVNTDLPIHINGQKVPSVKQPKILGVTFDNMHTFRYHADNIKTKVQSRNNILKALAGSTWGKESEVILSTYKAIGQSIYNYCSPIWSPSIADSKWKELQTPQNGALRTALGCVKMTKIDHLHSESKMMPVKDHCQMLSKQFLLKAQQPNHPCHTDIHNATLPPRLMKNTLSSVHGDYIRGLNPNNDNQKVLLKKIHTDSVAATIAAQEDNPVLNAPAPAIDKSEKNLPRKARTSLSQLRSGYSSRLNSYLSRIRDDVEDICPDCNQQSHTTNHLFKCSAKPTNLTVQSLWSKPDEAATFLGLLDAQNDENG